MSNSCVGYVTESLEGHREEYLDFVISEFGGKRISSIGAIKHSNTVMFLMADEKFWKYFFVATIRSFLQQHTVGLLFRPQEALIRTTWRSLLKKALLTILAKQSKTSTLCIIPKHILPEIDSITDGWIYDLQLWDLSENDRQLVAQLRTLGICEDESASKMFQSIRAATGGRKALVAIGRQSQDKGLDVLMQFCGIAKEHWATVVAGKCPNATAKQTILEGHGLVIDRHIKREELLAAYAAADAVWCLYSPSYNQASGVLGRAIQLGIPAIVRSNSVSDEISEYCGASTIASTSAEHLFEALRCVGEVDPKIGREISNYLREQSITTLRHELTTQRKEISEKTS